MKATEQGEGVASSSERSTSSEERCEEIKKILRVDEPVGVEVTRRLKGEERGDEIKQILRVDNQVKIDVRAGRRPKKCSELTCGVQASCDGLLLDVVWAIDIEMIIP